MRTSVHVTSGRPGLPVAVVLPGTGSTADFVTRAFGPALDAAGFALATADPEPGSDVVTAAFDALDEAVARYRPRLVGGVSLGAHVAARWAAARDAPGSPFRMWSPDGLLLALPAWTGPPADVAAASARAAYQIRQRGLTRTLADARRNAVPWIGEEITRAWPGYGDALADTLDAAAASAGPAAPELGQIRIPVGLVAFTDDPLHPVDVAECWHAVLPYSSLRRLRLVDCASHRAALGDAAMAAWLQARQNRASPRPPGADDAR